MDPARCHDPSPASYTQSKAVVATVKVSAATTITNIIAHIVAAGTSVSDSWAALYDSSGNRIGQTASQNTAWQSTGTKTMALTSPVAVDPGIYRVAVASYSASTRPTFLRDAHPNIASVGGVTRTGISSSNQASAPATLPALDVNTAEPWIALS